MLKIYHSFIRAMWMHLHAGCSYQLSRCSFINHNLAFLWGRQALPTRPIKTERHIYTMERHSLYHRLITDIKSQLTGRGHTKETGNLNATAISENCYQSRSWTPVSEWSSANWGNGNATRGKTKLNFQATGHASLLTTALSRGFLVSAVL
jgi:hypothetical protein